MKIIFVKVILVIIVHFSASNFLIKYKNRHERIACLFELFIQQCNSPKNR
jgi:hypothetical protein